MYQDAELLLDQLIAKDHQKLIKLIVLRCEATFLLDFKSFQVTIDFTFRDPAFAILKN